MSSSNGHGSDYSIELRSEFARVRIEKDDAANGTRLKIVDVKSGKVGFLDPLELEQLAWARHSELSSLLDPARIAFEESPNGHDDENAVTISLAARYGRSAYIYLHRRLIMPETAVAAVLTGPKRTELKNFSLPQTGKDDALLKVEACGGCGSDISPYVKGGTERGTLPMKAPLILGHEVVGRVENLGEKVAERWGVEEGDRVIIERWIPCGHCEMCYAGNYRLCIREVEGYGLFYGGTSTDVAPSLWGGFAEYLYLHPDSVVYKVSEEPPAELFPLFTPLGNGISWVQIIGGARIGSTVLIEGPGPAGIGCVIAARAAGAHQIIVTGLERDAARLELSSEMGATHTLVVDQENPVKRVEEITDGKMADVVVDATSGPNTEPIRLALDLAAEGGTVVLAGMHGGKPATNIVTDRIVSRTLSIRGAWGRHREAVFSAIRLIESGQYPLEKLCTHEFSLDAVDEAMETVAGNVNKSALHVSVVP